MPELSTISRKKIPLARFSKTGILGDSIAAQKSSAILLALMSLGYNISRTIYAIGGTKIEQQSSKIPEMVADGIDSCFIQVGTNNIGDADKSLIYEKYSDLIDSLRESGIEPHFCEVPPQNAGASSISVSRINTALYYVCKNKNVRLYNLWESLFLAAGGWSMPTTNSDGTHPANSTRIVGSTNLKNLESSGKSCILVAKTSYDGLLSNPCFVADTNSDGLADSWSGSSGAWLSYSLVSDGSNGHKKQRITLTNPLTGNTGYFIQTVSISPSRKFRLSFVLDFTCDDSLVSQIYMNVYIAWRDAGNQVISETPSYRNAFAGNNYVEFEAESPANAVSATVYFGMATSSNYTGIVSMDVSRVLLQDLTALGIP